MLFTEEQLYTTADPFRILDEAVYLTERESAVLPQTIPIVENSRLQAYIIDFNGVRKLAESSGIGYLDAIVAITEADGIPIGQTCIAIDEAELIENPSLINLGPVVIRPLSEEDDEFQFCLEVVEAYIDTDDESLLNMLLESSIEDTAKIKKLEASSKFKDLANAAKVKKVEAVSKLKQLRLHAKIKKMEAAQALRGFASTASERLQPVKKSVQGVVDKAKSKFSSITGIGVKSKEEQHPSPNQEQKPETPKEEPKAEVSEKTPKSAIAKRIAALRKTYAGFMQRAKEAPNEGVKNRLKKAASKILGVIDKLLAWLQRKID